MRLSNDWDVKPQVSRIIVMNLHCHHGITLWEKVKEGSYASPRRHIGTCVPGR